MKNSAIVACLALSFSTHLLLAQEEAVRNINRHRVLYTKWNFSDFFHPQSKWNWDLDVVYRRQSDVDNNEISDNPLRLSIRPWVGYQFAKLTRISISPIGWVNSMERSVVDSDLPVFGERELRSTLQINNNAYYRGRYNFTHRIRFESRWRALDQPDIRQNFRVRYRIRSRIPLNNDYFYVNRTVYLNLYSEIHVEFGGDFSSTNHLSQSRNYAGIGYRFWDWARIELGYLHQYMPRSNFYDVDLLYGPMFYLYIDLMSRVALRR